MTKLQLCQKLVLAVNAFISKECKCFICDKYYYLNFDSTGIRCAQCSRPSHNHCTNGLYLPKGFYWKCPDCDDQENNKNLAMIFQRLRKLMTREDERDSDIFVKSEPKFHIFSLDNGDKLSEYEKPHGYDDIFGDHDEESLDINNIKSDSFDNDIVDDDDNVDNGDICFPQRGFMCDICEFHTFNQDEFQVHVNSEEEKYIFVQESISSPEVPKSCGKCGEQCTTLTKLYEHVILSHSRPIDFPDFGDVEWKFLMSLGQVKRSCRYCSTSFENIEEWILHMKLYIGQHLHT